VTVLGLPFHPLIVHATVVAVPAAALSVLLATVWPRFRRWASWGPAALSVVALVLVPVTTSSGESLEHSLPHDALIETHAHLADGLLPWVIVLAVGALAALYPRLAATRPALWSPARWFGAVVALVSVVGAVGALVEVVLIGHSGAAAAWSDVGGAS